MANIMIVEDEHAINDLITTTLEMTGHSCTQAFCGNDAITCAQNNRFDLMLLDVMLPDIDGFSLLDRIVNTPAIFITAKHDTSDKVRGFTKGADDYITKPFEITELLLRVQAVLRRTQITEAFYEIGDLTIKFDAKQVLLRGKPVDLTLQEYNLLQVLLENRNVALSRQRLLNEAWGFNYMGETRTVDVHVQKLRKKLELEDRINTVFKVGYRFED